MPILKINFCSMFLWLSVLPRWREMFLIMVGEVEMLRFNYTRIKPLVIVCTRVSCYLLLLLN